MFSMETMHDIYSTLGIQTVAIEDPTAEGLLRKGDPRIQKVTNMGGICYIVDKSFAGASVNLNSSLGILAYSPKKVSGVYCTGLEIILKHRPFLFL